MLSDRQELLQLFRRSAQFSEELIQENEKLRFRLAELEAHGQYDVPTGSDVSVPPLVDELLGKVRQLEQDKEHVARQAALVEEENKNYAARYVQIEAENNSLMAIYVASYQLHSTLDFTEVLQIITEIILNFIGAEVFVVGMLDEENRTWVPLINEGMPPDEVRQLAFSNPIVQELLRKQEPLVLGEMHQQQHQVDAPVVAVPLQIKGKMIGAIFVYRFLNQKSQLGHVDHELFSLLAGHAATAVFSAKMYTDSKRKLTTIQGLLDLVRS